MFGKVSPAVVAVGVIFNVAATTGIYFYTTSEAKNRKRRERREKEKENSSSSPTVPVTATAPTALPKKSQ